MQQINSSADFKEALHAERAIIFIFFEWSRQSLQSWRVFESWAAEFSSRAGKINCNIYRFAPDNHPNAWKWTANAIGDGDGDGVQACGAVLWLRQGTIVGRAHSAAEAGHKILTRITDECFALGKTGISPTSFADNAEMHSFDAGLLTILCCPETHQPLAFVGASALEKLNTQIAAGRLRNRAGQPVAERLNAGLVRADGKFLYPLRHNIPILLVDEAVPLPG